MTYPTTFANLATGNQPLSLIDTMFQVVGQQGALPCVVSGTANAITLTPGTNYYAPATLTNGLLLSFLATANSTAAMTVQLLALGALNLYTARGVVAAANDVVSGSHYLVQYWSDLNSSSGGWIIVNGSGNSIGYGPAGEGIGGTVTQTTSRTNPVTINKLCGQITMVSATGSTSAYADFIVNNNLVGINDNVIIHVGNGASILNVYNVFCYATFASSFGVAFISAIGVGADAPILNFSVIKSVNS